MLFGVALDRKNPEFTIKDFTFWMPQFKNYMNTEDGQVAFDNIYEVVNNKIFSSIFGVDWKLAMSYAIAHYLTIIAQQVQAPSGDTLASIAGGGNIKGVLASASIGNFSKSYDLGKTMIESEEAAFWNQTSYGAALMALLKTKALPSMFVITNDPKCIPSQPRPPFPGGIF